MGKSQFLRKRTRDCRIEITGWRLGTVGEGWGRSAHRKREFFIALWDPRRQDPETPGEVPLLPS